MARTDTDHEAIQFLRDLRGARDYRVDLKARFVKKCLQDIAAVTGDKSSDIAQFTPDDLRRKPVAAEIAMLMLEENAFHEALAALNKADDGGGRKDRARGMTQ